MGLAKELPLGTTGVSATYWRIVKMELDIPSGGCIVHVAGYVDKAGRDAGKAPLMVKPLSVPGVATKEALEGQNVMAALYVALKAASGTIEPWPLSGASDA